jgi:hypothetical protein
MKYNISFIVLKFPIKENNIIDDIFAKFDGALFDGVFAKNTIRAYKSDFIQYQNWCLQNNLEPIPAGSKSRQLMSIILVRTTKAPPSVTK